MQALTPQTLLTDGTVRIDTKNGSMTAVGEGYSVIKAVDSKGRSVTMNVSVKALPNNPVIYLVKGKSEALKAPKLDIKKSEISAYDDTIVSVKDGKVTGLNLSSDDKPGATDLLCTYKPFEYSKGFKYLYRVYVEAPTIETDDTLTDAGGSNEKKINLKISLDQGALYDLSGQYRGIAQAVTWKSSKPAVAFVDENGNIRANSAGNTGKTVLSTKVNGVTIKVEVNVK